MSSPKVVVKNKYTPSYNNLNFHYRTKQAVHTSTMNMFDYFADIKKKAFFMLDYFSGKIGKTVQQANFADFMLLKQKLNCERNNMKNM